MTYVLIALIVVAAVGLISGILKPHIIDIIKCTIDHWAERQQTLNDRQKEQDLQIEAAKWQKMGEVFVSFAKSQNGQKEDRK